MERRNTKQRELVLNAVMELRNHATAEEIYNYIAKDHPSIGKGTVYRNLNILSDNGKIRKVSMPNGPDRYDHSNDLKHYHIQCIHCNKLFDIDIDTLKGIEDNIRNAGDFEITGYDLIFHGVCPECRKKSKK